MRRGLIGALLALPLAAAAQPKRPPLQHGMRLRPEHGDQGFDYVFHEPSQQWVGQECQLRVAAARPLPQPLRRPDHEPTLVVQQFGGLTIDSARILGGAGNVQREVLREGVWHWWWIDKSIGDVELKRVQRLGVQLRWPDEPAGEGVRTEAMELFELAAIDTLPPGQWGGWQRPTAVVAGADAALQVARRRQPAAPAPSELPWPFELRCRAALWQTPYRRERG